MYIPDTMLAELLELGASPEEQCGLLLLTNDLPTSVHALPNRAPEEERKTRTDIHGSDIADLLERLGAADKWPGEVVLWHTHPSGFVGPSEQDLRSRVPGVRYLVVALPTVEQATPGREAPAGLRGPTVVVY